MIGEVTIESDVAFTRSARGRKQLSTPDARGVNAEQGAPMPGRVPRVARLMALALHFERLLAEGKVKDLADIARLGHVTRARATQVMNLTLLAPDIQEQILFMPLVDQGRDPLKEWQLRSIAACADWRKQRRLWAQLAQP